MLLTPEQLIRHVAAHYAQSQQTAGPYDTVVLASRRSDVTALNTAIRAQLRADGRLGPDQLTLPDPHGQPLPFAVGDLVMVTRNDPARGIFNGTRGHITTANPRELGLRLDSGQHLTLPVDAVAGRLTHAYALTVHKAQGLTVDTCLLYGTAALSRQAGYVGLSRGRQENHLYTSLASLDTDRDDVSAPAFRLLDGPDPTDIHDTLIDRLRRTPRHVLALDQQPWHGRDRYLSREAERRADYAREQHEQMMRDHHRDHGRGR